jgi:twinkle protein
VSDESHLLYKGPCEECGSSDANAHYSDGHTFCFVCNHYTAGDDAEQPREKRKRVSGLITEFEVRGLRVRKLTDETCRKFGYGIGKYKGQNVQIAPYYDREGNLVAQHLRTHDKEFPWLGHPKEAMPFGYHVFPKNGLKLVLTEGEIDAMSFSQAQGNKWPVWSIGCGAGKQVRKYIADRRELFLQFDEVVIMFDNDEPGREAAKAAAEVIGARARIAELPLKDASDMLVAGRVEELLTAMWRATPYRPDGIVDLLSLREKVFSKVEMGLPWYLDELTEWTYGRRLGEVYCLGAGTGVGKTDFLTEQIAYDIDVLGLDVATFFFEQEPAETALRIAGKIGKRPFHVPDAGWSETELEEAWARIERAKGKLSLYNSFGICDWDVVKERIRYLYHAENVRHFYIDHLTALAAWQDDERKALELIMSDIGGMVKELGIAVYLVSHLATPEGKPHEEGGRVMIRHFKGSRAIGFWCHYMFGLERNQQAADPLERITTTLRCLKDRYTGRATGNVMYLRYDQDTAQLSAVNLSEDERPRTAEENPFAESGESAKDDF